MTSWPGKMFNIHQPFGQGIHWHYSNVIMGTMASQITSLTIVYSTVYSGADQRKHQSSASLAFVRGIRRWPVNSSHKWPVTRKMLSFDDVIMGTGVWVTAPIFFLPFFSLCIQNFRSICSLYNITFIFDRGHCSWVAKTPKHILPILLLNENLQ